MKHALILGLGLWLSLVAHAQNMIVPDVEHAPNPAFIRQSMLDLNGPWRFVAAKTRGEIQTPYVPQSKMSGLERPIDVEALTYEREFTLPANWNGALVHFEGVDYEAEVYLDGKLLGEHRGGYDPFQLNLALAQGKTVRTHRLTVKVKDSDSHRAQLVGKQERTANEGVIFYKNMTGIWKSVWLEKVSAQYLTDLKVETDAQGRFSLKGLVQNTGGGGLTAKVILSFEGREVVFQKDIPVTREILLNDQIAKAQLWSPEAPNLYFIEVVLSDANGNIVDQVKSYTGFRTFEQRDGYFQLNGKPYQLRGVLDQGIYADSLYTPTETEVLRDIQYAKAAGFNGARIHQTTPTHRRLWNADHLGFWSSLELPSARNLKDPADFQEATRQWEKILSAYAFSRPTVFYVVPSNEDWGWLEDKDHWAPTAAEEREFVQHALLRHTLAAAPSGMIVSAQDGWRSISAVKHEQTLEQVPGARLMTSLHDYRTSAQLQMTYQNIPGAARAGTLIPDNGKPAFLEGYQYDGWAPIVMSEAGGRAVDLGSKAKIFAYGSLFRDAKSWSLEMGNVIQTLGGLPILRGGFVITQMRDAGNDPSDPDSGGELNGLLTADGHAKVSAAQFRAANREAQRRWEKNQREIQRALGCEALLI